MKNSKRAPKLEVKPDFVPRRSREVLARNNSDGSVALLRLDTDDYFYTIDGIAAEVWSLIDGKLSVGAIKDKLGRKHQPLPDAFDQEIAAFLADLAREDLLDLA